MLMKFPGKKVYIGALCGCLLSITNAQTTLEGFEYTSDDELLASWTPSSALLSLSPWTAPNSGGTNSLRIERFFPASTWETEIVNGPLLPEPVAINPSHFITLRVAGDPQFTNATYQTLFVYAFDGNGNWGRWGSPVPTTTNWQIFNFAASNVEKPWDSPALPDLGNIIQFKLYIYGQGDPPGTEFPATFYVDDITVRETALVEFPPPSPMRALIDDFESYADDTALLGTYRVVTSPAATAATASLDTPAPQGNKALKMAIDFAPGQWPWGSVRSAKVAPFSLPTNAVVQCKFKGDPALASVLDAGTTFWLTFYDEGGRSISFNNVNAPVTSSEWTTVQARYGDFWSTTPVDTGNLVEWRILVQGWTGTAESQPLSGAFYVDDIRVTIPPELSIVQEGSALTLQMGNLLPGTTYTVRQTENFSQWTTATTIQATSSTATWSIPAGQKGFFQLSYTP